MSEKKESDSDVSPPDHAPVAVADDTRVEPDENNVAAKVYDDEVVLMHLGSGAYASIETLGAIVWECIEKRYSVREIAAVLTAHYDVVAAQARNDARALVAALLSEQLVRTATAAEPCAVVGTPPARQPYTAPQLVVYRDMEDLLALDPPLPQYAEAPWRKP